MIVIVLMCTTCLVQAQLLKKLKDKAAKALEKKPEEKKTNTEEETTVTETSNTDNNKTTKTTVATPPANGNIVFSLGVDEVLLYDESAILLKNNKVSYSFVIKNKKSEYFLIEDSVRTGPFKEAPIKSLQTTSDDGETSSTDDAVSIGNDKKDPVAIQYSKTIDSKLYLVFNNKNYGPYDFVSKMLVSPDKKHFFALVTIGGENNMTAKMGMGYTFIVNDLGMKQKAGTSGITVPAKFSASEGFKHAMASVMDQKDQKVISVTTAGKQQEGSINDMYTNGTSITFVNDNGDIVSVPAQSPTQLLVNGKEVAAFKVPIKNMNRLFLTPDLSKSMYYEKGTLYRADGTEESLAGIVFPKVVTVKNETSVYYFKVYKNENGVKDVYLCKKKI